jgi:hypothetical protein
MLAIHMLLEGRLRDLLPVDDTASSWFESAQVDACKLWIRRRLTALIRESPKQPDEQGSGEWVGWGEADRHRVPGVGSVKLGRGKPPVGAFDHMEPGMRDWRTGALYKSHKQVCEGKVGRGAHHSARVFRTRGHCGASGTRSALTTTSCGHRPGSATSTHRCPRQRCVCVWSWEEVLKSCGLPPQGYSPLVDDLEPVVPVVPTRPVQVVCSGPKPTRRRVLWGEIRPNN